MTRTHLCGEGIKDLLLVNRVGAMAGMDGWRGSVSTVSAWWLSAASLSSVSLSLVACSLQGW